MKQKTLTSIIASSLLSLSTQGCVLPTSSGILQSNGSTQTQCPKINYSGRAGFAAGEGGAIVDFRVDSNSQGQTQGVYIAEPTPNNSRNSQGYDSLPVTFGFSITDENTGCTINTNATGEMILPPLPDYDSVRTREEYVLPR